MLRVLVYSIFSFRILCIAFSFPEMCSFRVVLPFVWLSVSVALLRLAQARQAKQLSSLFVYTETHTLPHTLLYHTTPSEECPCHLVPLVSPLSLHGFGGFVLSLCSLARFASSLVKTLARSSYACLA
jgi:hypothetical protein